MRALMGSMGLGAVLVAASVCAWAQAAPEAAAQEAVSAKVWIGREAEFESYLKEAEVIGKKAIGVGVTKPWRVDLRAGGPIERFAWKPIKPGIYSGYFESYKAEVAAYELDKLLGLGMVPVTVERRVDGAIGAACMWVTPAESFKDLGGVPTPPAAESERWNHQLTRAKMFDLLINNLDPNLGNWMVDPAWNIILIDHSRAFTTRGGRRVHELTRVDLPLWERILQLDEETLSAALGQWLKRGEIRAILARRERMQKEIDALGQ
jgi:hypothetical protein